MDYTNTDEIIHKLYEGRGHISVIDKILRDAPDSLKNDKNFFLKLRKVCDDVSIIHCLKHIGDTLSNDEEFILYMSQGEGHNLSCASEKLRGKREFMERACTILDPADVVAVATPELKKSKEFILNALANTDEGWLIVSADEKLFDDEDIRRVISEKYDSQRVLARMEEIKAEEKTKE